MLMNNILRPTVGADLSRPAPIYRPSLDVPISGLFFKLHYRPSLAVRLSRL